MSVNDTIEENQSRLRLMNPKAFKVEWAHGSIRLTCEDIIELGNSNPNALMQIKKRFHKYGYKDYRNENQ
jgi:hypothetical protein